MILRHQFCSATAADILRGQILPHCLDGSTGTVQKDNVSVHGAWRAKSLQKWTKELGIRLFG